MRKMPGVTLLVVSILATAAAMAQATPAPPTPARPVVNAQAEEEIKALEAKLANLILHDAWDEYEKLLVSDYAGIAYDGKLESREATMSNFRSGRRKIVVLEPEDLRVRTYGETAVLQGLLTIWARESGRLSTKIERFTEVFVKQDGQWLLAARQGTAAPK